MLKYFKGFIMTIYYYTYTDRKIYIFDYSYYNKIFNKLSRNQTQTFTDAFPKKGGRHFLSPLNKKLNIVPFFLNSVFGQELFLKS